MAMAIATHSAMRVRLLAISQNRFPEKPPTNVNTVNAAANVNHFIWSRSSPRDRRYRRTTATSAKNSNTGKLKKATGKKTAPMK